MIREFITIDDFKRISTENEYFIWNFVREDILINDIEIKSYFYIKSNYENPLKSILMKIQIPYFESFTNENTFNFLSSIIILLDSSFLFIDDSASFKILSLCCSISFIDFIVDP